MDGCEKLRSVPLNYKEQMAAQEALPIKLNSDQKYSSEIKNYE